MFTKIKNKFKENPSLYYSMSIAATWAGVGSLMNGMTMVRQYGIIPFIIWALGNTLTCIVFGIFAPRIPKLREVFRSKVMFIIMGLMSIFQIWLSMNGIQSVFAETVLGGNTGMIIAYAFAVLYIILLLKYGMIRNVLTDTASWIAVYGAALLLTVLAIISSRGNMIPLSWGLDASNIGVGCNKGLLLFAGAFLYPYYYEILDYNDHNGDATEKVNITRAFINGGLLFSFYLVFTFILAWTNFSPVLNIIKAVLVTLIAISTLSSFQYSIYITFGKKLGLALNAGAVLLWQYLIPLGVMGAWTLMAKIRIYIVAAGIIAAIVWHLREKRCSHA